MDFQTLYAQGRFIRAAELCDRLTKRKLQMECGFPLLNITHEMHHLKAEDALRLIDDVKYDKCQMIVEEAIDFFEHMPRTNIMNAHIGYVILNNSICNSIFSFRNIMTPKLRQYIENFLQSISIPLMVTILSSDHKQCDNDDACVKLLHHFLTLELTQDTKDQVIQEFLKSWYNEYNISPTIIKLILHNFNPVAINVRTECDQLKLNLIIDKAVWMSNKEFIKYFGYSESTLHDILVNNRDNPKVARKLALWCCDGQSNYYSLEEAAHILYSDPMLKYDTKAIYILADLVLNNKIHNISDTDIVALLTSVNKYESAQLLEHFYAQNRCVSQQKLVIANNTSHNLHYTVMITHNQIDEFILVPSEQKIYRNLRDNNVSTVGLTVRKGETVLVTHNFIDIHAYVSMYMRREQITFALYYEPDPYLDSLTPTDNMINVVAIVMKQKYEEQKENYPNMTYKFFVETLGCSVGDVNWSDDFEIKVTSLLRPKVLKHVIEMLV